MIPAIFKKLAQKLANKQEQRDFFRDTLFAWTKFDFLAFSNAEMNAEADDLAASLSFSETAFKNFFSKVFSLLDKVRF